MVATYSSANLSPTPRLSSAPGPGRRRPQPADDRPPPAQAASTQTCPRCGACFRWERGDPDDPNAVLTARLETASERCDCGYGRGEPTP
ncbi:hypothetical protein [Roseospirillum parvum]|uniref:hypothetical protein n=1 Tax=Roseospirillum parvum TaxID=83401 RepID=UPI000B847639|nr:hypothetical protein [Roseospirillum parvum]